MYGDTRADCLWLGRGPSPRTFCLHNPALVPVEAETDPFSARLSSPPQFLPCCPGHLCEGTVYPTSTHRVRLLERGFATPFPPLMSESSLQTVSLALSLRRDDTGNRTLRCSQPSPKGLRPRCGSIGSSLYAAKFLI